MLNTSKIGYFALLVLLQLSLVSSQCDNPPDQLNAAFFPSLDLTESGLKSLNEFMIVIKSEMVNDRSEAWFSWPDRDDECAGISFIRTESNCDEIYTATLDWQKLTTCFEQEVVTTTTILRVDLLVHQLDFLENVREFPQNRTQETLFSMTLTLQRHDATEDAQLTVHSSVDLRAATVGISAVSAYANIRLFTSVQFPYQLASAVVEADNEYTVSILPVEGGEDCPADEDCVNMYDIRIDDEGVAPCDISGTYTVDFTLKCHSSVATQDCPLQGEPAQIVITITNGNICGTLSEDHGMTAALTSHKAAGDGQSRVAFIQNQVIYMKASVTSPLVAVEETYIVSCSATVGGSTTSLFSDGTSEQTGTPLAADFGLDVASNSETTAWFHFDASDELYNIEEDGSVSGTVTCIVGVVYQYVDEDEQVKRSVAFVKTKRDVNYQQGETNVVAKSSQFDIVITDRNVHGGSSASGASSISVLTILSFTAIVLTTILF